LQFDFLLQNTFWQTVLFSEHFSHLEAEGLEIDDRQKSQAVVAHQESLMKLFAVSTVSFVLIKNAIACTEFRLVVNDVIIET
jgi:hypothetical protein